MAEPEPSFLSCLSEQERLHFRNLALIRPQSPSEGQLNLIGGLASNLTHPRLLTLIARTPHWLVHGPVLFALAQNEATPESIRRDLELAVSICEMMHTMDRSPEPERKEIADAIKDLYDLLPGELKPIVKQLLKQMARQARPGAPSQDTPLLLPEGEVDWESLTAPPAEKAAKPAPIRLSMEELRDRAATTPIEDELVSALMDPDTEIRSAGLCNPMLSEELLQRLLPVCDNPWLLEAVYAEARWYFRPSIREALYEAPFLPPAIGRKMRISLDLIACIRDGSRSRKALHRIVSLFSQLNESEFQFITFWAKRYAPGFLRIIKTFYDRLRRKQKLQATAIVGQASPVGKAAETIAETTWPGLEERVFIANQSSEPDQILAALRDPDLTVFSIVLENPMLQPRELLSAIPAMEEQKVELLARHRQWGEYPAVQEALLHNVHLSPDTALHLIETLDTPKVLLDLLRDARIPHIEVKQQALESLRRLYQGMGLGERIAALRVGGGEWIRHLPQEVLNDEETLELLIADRQLDPGTLLRLARNKQTPRHILEAVSKHPVVASHPTIMTELLLNPRTPKGAAKDVWSLLPEQDRSQILKNPHLPVALRSA